MGGWVSKRIYGFSGRKCSRHRIEAYLDRLFGYALSLAIQPDQAHDLVQTCALKALSAKNIPSDEPAYCTWLFRILRNTFLDEQRKRHNDMSVWDELDQEAKGGGNSGNNICSLDVSSVEERMLNVLAVREGLKRIGVAHREVLVLVDVVGFSYKEVADMLKVPLGTVMSRVSRARKRLLQELDGKAVQPRHLRIVRRGS